MATVEAELKRRDAALALVDWLLAADAENTATGLSDPVVEYGLRARLAQLSALVVELGGMLPGPPPRPAEADTEPPCEGPPGRCRR